MFGRSKTDEVSVEEAAKQQEAGAVLLDVREPDEWAAGHAPGAVHVVLGAVPGAIDRLEGQTVLTVCRSGSRSAKAAQALADAGLEVRNVAGGMSSWAGAGLPVVRDDGSPGSII